MINGIFDKKTEISPIIIQKESKANINEKNDTVSIGGFLLPL
jgi:hypothetical protein